MPLLIGVDNRPPWVPWICFVATNPQFSRGLHRKGGVVIEFLVRLDDSADPVLLGRANCSRAVPELLDELAGQWREELQLRAIAAASGVNYTGVTTVG